MTQHTVNVVLTIDVEDELTVRSTAFKRIMAGNQDVGGIAEMVGKSIAEALGVLLTQGEGAHRWVAQAVPTARLVSMSAVTA